ncbi:alkyl hydroperoxide reductase subunit F [Burkholderia thailandensis 34]|uniref:alkyl hydroperoxide reductase subunit F n=1 Tax=Burkholderia thailandensis TaxID=57975 RepID=UPI0005D85610|nr:alkyl hydroperoxide reductase subunit F [Burkholderia thailandensis]AJY32793.1 alkyl hydroperoxide reductase subunit F [Burkholderia thailandensis 34]AOJ60363.1 alkyl hydroperoxide reductase subunit F [Burkholderia thailandensis]KXF57354.1 alkyl hydroperoxide reductase subunit F [Burkholderia thailandensis]PNE77909.1 alkyl hydroperoxide reductase subunit F [Burkholderia thailandensis]
MLDANLKTQLKSYLERITRPVELVASLDDGDKSRELRALLDEIASLSPQVFVVERRDEAERAPSFSVGEPGEAARIRFAGIPMGHEFTSLVLALLQTGGHPVKLDDATIEQIRALDGDYTFETYISLTCQNCPEVVQALNVMALVNPRIRHVMIDGALFQDEVDARRIMAVPTIFLNGETFGQGRSSVKEILAKLDSGASRRAAQALAAKPVFDMLIVGGGPAGAAAAIYAARKGISTGVVAERFGGQVLDTMAIENFVSVTETEGPKFATALEQHVKQYDVDVIDVQRADRLVPGSLHEIRLASGAVLKAKAVVLATGARWREIGVPGEREYRNRGVAYCPHCDGPLFKGKRVAVVGGGNSGVEAAIDLAGIVSEVTLIEYGAQLRADEVLQRKLRSLPNVTVLTHARTTELAGDGARLNALVYEDMRTGETKRIALEGVFVQIGLVPNTEWLKGTVELSKHGEIVVDARGATSVPGVFAAGDVTTVPYKQIVIAVGEGAKASLGAFDYLIRSDADAVQPADADAPASAEMVAA